MVSDVSIVRTYGDKDPCGCDNSCGDSCCKDDVQTIKVEDSHKSEAKFNQNSSELIIAILDSEIPSSQNNIIPQKSRNIFCDNFTPPDLYLNNCSLLI